MPAAQNQPKPFFKSPDTLKIIPLGGLDHIGKNMMALEYSNDIIVVDMGFMFPTDEMLGIDYIIPDITYLEARKHKIRAHLITHAHEDHVGGIPFILPKLPAPIYGSRFTLAYIEKKLQEYKLRVAPQFRVMDPDKHESVQLGVFKVEFVRVTHSIPDACAIVIETPVGRLIHTGDWRFDDKPVDGKVTDKVRLDQLGRQGVRLLMSDSTGCEGKGRTPSESDIEESFLQLFARSKGRIIVTTFASQINRLQQIINASQKSGRQLAFVGRSMLGNVELSIKLGYLKIQAGTIVKIQDAVRLPDHKVVIISTGNQGEANSALRRMASGAHAHVKIKPGDSVIMSSSVIPGNERSISATVDDLFREGAKVYQNSTGFLDDVGLLHVSGHGSRDDLAAMFELTRPQSFLPIHGELHHLIHHAELAVKTGIPQQNVYVVETGQSIDMTKDSIKLGARVPAGMVFIDGGSVGDVQATVLEDRMGIGTEGIFMIIVTVSRKTGQMLTSPDIISRGFIYMKDNEELIGRARSEIRKIMETRDKTLPASSVIMKNRLRSELSNFLYRQTHRNPMVVPVVIEV